MSDLDAIVTEFVVESRENLDQLERDLIDLEADPSSRAALGSIFRTVHTIKGAAGFTGMSRLETLAHAGEGVLSQLRDGALVINPAVTSALLTLTDRMRQMLTHIERRGEEGDIDCAALIGRLAELHDGDPDDDKQIVERPDRSESGRELPQTCNIRVSVEQLDKLMNLVGELVLARNEIVHFSSVQQNSALLGTSQRLNSITTQLQEGIMKTRMRPIEDVWNKLPRVVRNTAQHCGKLVRLEMEGRDTELDRTLIEAIQDPLTHVVRNAIDHGLEPSERRIAAGKVAEGCVSLRAFHEGGQVTIEVSDDGGGIDVAAIKRRAIERELMTAEQARGLSDQEALHLIFLPGLSTAKAVTSISGRGVGMDVVKTNIEQIGGRVTVHSEVGVGSTVSMRIPLTLAIMTALVVANEDECYAIPQLNVIELVRLEPEDAHERIEMVGGAAVYRLRGTLLPLVWLGAELQAERRSGSAGQSPHAPRVGREAANREAANIVVLQAYGVTFGLVVDAVQDMQEIIIKPLGRHVRGIPLFAGATILGDGKVTLILDVPGLGVRANVLSETRDRPSLPLEEPVEDACDGREALLLCAGSDEATMAIPLSQITRLEEFPHSKLERLSGQVVVQYFGDVLPLVPLRDLLAVPHRRAVPAALAVGDTLPTLVYSKGGRQVGVVVDRILDTMEHSLAELRPSSRPGVKGSLVIQGRVTEILDLDALCDGAGTALPAHLMSGAGA